MKIMLILSLFTICTLLLSIAQAGPTTQPTSALDFIVKDIAGKEHDLSQYKGKVVMIVNVASKCGNTPQYAGLEAMFEKYKDQGFVVLGFPANNFKGQEPGSDADILAFCTATYNVKFPLMSKVSVKGDDIAPLYKFLTTKETAGEYAGDVTWNFGKFLIGRDGKIAARFEPKKKVEEAEVIEKVEKALAAK